MANAISVIRLPNNEAYNFKVFSNNVAPIEKKVYTNTSYYATQENQDNSTWYFMSIKPEAWNKVWRISFKLYTYSPSFPNENSITFCTISGRQNGLTYVNFNDTDSIGHSFISCYPLKQAGFTANYGHAIGVSIFQASNYTTSNHYRTFEIELYDEENCTITWLNEPVKWSIWPGAGTTNYENLINFNASSRGLQQSNNDGQVALNLISEKNTNTYFCNIDVTYEGTESTYAERLENSWDSIMSEVRNKVGNFKFVNFMGNLGLTGSPAIGRSFIWGYAYIYSEYEIGVFFATKYSSEKDTIYVIKKSSPPSLTITVTKMVSRSEIESITNPDILDVLTPASDITISTSNVAVQNKLVIIDCCFSQSSTTLTNRFTFKNNYKPDASNTNIAPTFMYSNNKVSDTVLFINSTQIRMFGAAPVANQMYYFRLIYLIK